MQAGLQDPALMAVKRAGTEAAGCRQSRSEAARSYGDAWDEVAAAIATLQGVFTDLSLLESGDAFNSKLFDIARTLVRLAEETQKPNDDAAARVFRGGLDSLKQQLFSTRRFTTIWKP